MLQAIKRFIKESYELPSSDPLDKFPGPLPHAFTLADIPVVTGTLPIDPRYEKHVVSPKADGTRKLLGIFWVGKEKMVFTINRKWEWTKHTDLIPILPEVLFQKTLIDMEECVQADGSRHWLFFDTVRVCGNHVMKREYIFRAMAAARIVAQVNQPMKRWSPPYAIFPTQWSTWTPQYQVVAKPIFYLKDMQRALEWFPMKQDGLVFTPIARPCWRRTKVYKWKPPHEQTVDFMLRYQVPFIATITDEAEDGNPYECMRGPWQLLCSNDKPFASIPGDEKRYESNIVYECGWQGNRWVPLYPRPDKEHGNSEYVTRQTIQSIREQLSVKEILCHLGIEQMDK